MNSEIIEKLIKLPLKIGEYNGTDVMLNIGGYGYYVSMGEERSSIGKIDPFSIDVEKALELLEKQREKIKKNSKTFNLGEDIGEITIQKAGFGKVYTKIKQKKILIPLKFDEINEENIKPFVTPKKATRVKKSK